MDCHICLIFPSSFCLHKLQNKSKWYHTRIIYSLIQSYSFRNCSPNLYKSDLHTSCSGQVQQKRYTTTSNITWFTGGHDRPHHLPGWPERSLWLWLLQRLPGNQRTWVSIAQSGRNGLCKTVLPPWIPYPIAWCAWEMPLSVSLVLQDWMWDVPSNRGILSLQLTTPPRANTGTQTWMTLGMAQRRHVCCLISKNANYSYWLRSLSPTSSIYGFAIIHIPVTFIIYPHIPNSGFLIWIQDILSMPFIIIVWKCTNFLMRCLQEPMNYTHHVQTSTTHELHPLLKV